MYTLDLMPATWSVKKKRKKDCGKVVGRSKTPNTTTETRECWLKSYIEASAFKSASISALSSQTLNVKKERRRNTDKHASVQTFSVMCCWHQIQKECIFILKKRVHQFEQSVSRRCAVFNWGFANDSWPLLTFYTAPAFFAIRVVHQIHQREAEGPNTSLRHQ